MNDQIQNDEAHPWRPSDDPKSQKKTWQTPRIVVYPVDRTALRTAVAVDGHHPGS